MFTIFRLDTLSRCPCHGKYVPGSCLQPWEISLPSWPSLQQHLFVGHCLSESFRIVTSPPSLESTYYLSRQFLLLFSLHVLILGQTMLPIRDNLKGGGYVGLWWEKICQKTTGYLLSLSQSSVALCGETKPHKLYCQSYRRKRPMQTAQWHFVSVLSRSCLSCLFSLSILHLVQQLEYAAL